MRPIESSRALGDYALGGVHSAYMVLEGDVKSVMDTNRSIELMRGRESSLSLLVSVRLKSLLPHEVSPPKRLL